MDKKILFLTDTLDIGGAERQLTLLVKYLPEGWERRIWSLGNGPFAEVIRRNGIPLDVQERRQRLDIVPLINLWKTIIRWHPDIVHSYGWLVSAAAGPLCRILNIPFIDGSIRIGQPPLRNKQRAKMALALADRVIANSQAGLDAMKVPSTKGRVIYNGFDPDRLPLLEPTEHKGGPFTVIMSGRMSSSKDYCSFFNAARNLSTNYQMDGWRFQALGYGPDKLTLMNGAADLVERKILDFPEAGLEVLPYVREANVGVLLSEPLLHQEGCSNSIMEYMACGLPVICNESGGNCELVVDGQTGFIVPSKDVNAIVEKLLWLRTHPQEADSMGRAGRQRFLEMFSVEKLVEKTLSVYKELLPL